MRKLGRHSVYGLRGKTTEPCSGYKVAWSERQDEVFNAAVGYIKKRIDFEEQHGPVRHLMKDGKPVSQG